MRKIISYFKSVWIEIQRVYDHSIRRITGSPRAKRSMITPQLYLGGQYKIRGLKRLKGWGITAVVSMRERSFQQAQHADWLDYLHLPTKDLTAPSMEDLDKGIKFIQKHIDQEGKVYIHCHHGEGRGPSMAAAYLVSTGLTLQDALDQIRKVRTFILPTPVQLERLREFEMKLLK